MCCNRPRRCRWNGRREWLPDCRRRQTGRALMKAFLLDPANHAAPLESQLPAFLRLASAKAGWHISRPTTFEQGMDSARWFSDLRRGIEDADIIVGLGNFF